MARTRAQSQGSKAKNEEDTCSSKKATTKRASKTENEPTSKRKAASEKDDSIEEDSNTLKSSSPKRSKKSEPTHQHKSQSPSAPTDTKSSSSSNPTIEKLLSNHETLPLQDLGIPDPANPTPSNMLAHIFNAMLTSARISHDLATKSVKCLIEAGYHDLETLKKSSWEERTEVLTKGGYTRYREKTATGLGELAEFMSEKYGMRRDAPTFS